MCAGLKQVWVRDDNVQRLEHDLNINKHYYTIIIIIIIIIITCSNNTMGTVYMGALWPKQALRYGARKM